MEKNCRQIPNAVDQEKFVAIQEFVKEKKEE